MSDQHSESTVPAPSGLTPAEMELRRYEARLGVWKVIAGTTIVGIAGVALPFFLNLYNAYFDNARKEQELRYSQQTSHQQYIKEFFTTAISEDIELRIRFAQYFANLTSNDGIPAEVGGADPAAAGGRQEPCLEDGAPAPVGAGRGSDGAPNPWRRYLTELKCLRDTNRKKINDLESELLNYDPTGADFSLEQSKRFEQIKRELEWARAEIGAAPAKQSAARVVSKKSRLYGETTTIVSRLAFLTDRISAQSSDLTRFWELYKKDLIGVESSEFARTMVRIGSVLNQLAGANAEPSDELKDLAALLQRIAEEELSDKPAISYEQQALPQAYPEQQQMQQQPQTGVTQAQ